MWSKPTPPHPDDINDICAYAPVKDKLPKPYKTLVIEIIDEPKNQESRDGSTHFKTCDCNVLCEDRTVVKARAVFWSGDSHGAIPGQVLVVSNTSIKATEWLGVTTYTVHVNGGSIVQPAHRSIAQHMGNNSATATVLTDFRTMHAIGTGISYADGDRTMVMVTATAKGKQLDSSVSLATLASLCDITEDEFVIRHYGNKYRENRPVNATVTSDEIKAISHIKEAASTSTVRIPPSIAYTPNP